MASIRTVKTPDKYVWKCDEQHCHFGTEATDKTTVEETVARHRAMHRLSKTGTRVRIVGQGEMLRNVFPARPGDTGKITYAYIDQNRFGVLLDRKGKCEGCRHCDGCGGPTKLNAEVKFENLEKVRG